MLTSVYSAIDHPNDRTLSLLARNLMHGETTLELCISFRVIALILDPKPNTDYPSLYEQRQIYPVPQHFLRSLLHGAPNESATLFLTRLANSLPKLDVGELANFCDMLLALCKRARWGSEPDVFFVRAVCRSRPVFAYLFNILRNPEEVEILHEDAEQRAVAAGYIITLVLDLFRYVLNHWIDEQPKMIKNLVGAGLLDGLEGVFRHGQNWLFPGGTLCTPHSCLPSSPLARIAYVCHFTDCACQIMLQLRSVLFRNLSTLTFLRPEFPRPRFMHHLFDIAFYPKSSLIAWSNSGFQSHLSFLQKTWMTLISIQTLCQINGQCMRRGCSEPRRKRCKACRTVEYCSQECQRE